MKKILAIWILFILMSSGLLLIKAETNAAKTLYVDDDNTNGPWEGTLENPYNTIQDAIDHASRGDTISVFDGLYVENILVRVSISIIGEDKNNTIVDGNGKKDVFNITADNVEITRFTIQNSGKKYFFNRYKMAGIKIRANDVSIYDNNIINNKGSGIAIYQIGSSKKSTGLSIEHNNIIGNDIDGISVSVTDGLHIDYNTIQSNEYGIFLSGGLSACYITGNLISDNNYGIFSSTTVKDCAISSNVIENHKSKAISLLCENTIIFNNHINGALIGVDLFKEWNRFSNHICNNNILNCKICGFFEQYVFHDFWDGIPNCWEYNYYGISQDKPKYIFGKLLGFDKIKFIPWIEIDWHPAKEPYSINLYK